MKITILNTASNQSKIWDFHINFALRLYEVSEVWLFNCNEATQHNLLHHHIKLSLISKIFITDLNLYNIAGLQGLLSTLNLESRNKTLYLYGPQGLQSYLRLSSKYSRTNFSYPVEICNSSFSHSFVSRTYIVRILRFGKNNNQLSYIVFSGQKLGKFKLLKARVFNLMPGSLYGKLKRRNVFLMPDGNIIQGKQFSDIPEKGAKVAIVPYIYYNKTLAELCWQSDNIVCLIK